MLLVLWLILNLISNYEAIHSPFTHDCFRVFSVKGPETFTIQLFMTQLENGLQVLVIEDNSVPLATIEIAVHNGSYTEDSAFNGLSHLYEHMFLRRIKISLHRRHISKEYRNWASL